LFQDRGHKLRMRARVRKWCQTDSGTVLRNRFDDGSRSPVPSTHPPASYGMICTPQRNARPFPLTRAHECGIERGCPVGKVHTDQPYAESSRNRGVRGFHHAWARARMARRDHGHAARLYEVRGHVRDRYCARCASVMESSIVKRGTAVGAPSARAIRDSVLNAQSRARSLMI
jgi:hypothetical protein